jgi:hypothetical protein
MKKGCPRSETALFHFSLDTKKFPSVAMFERGSRQTSYQDSHMEKIRAAGLLTGSSSQRSRKNWRAAANGFTNGGTVSGYAGAGERSIGSHLWQPIVLGLDYICISLCWISRPISSPKMRN